MGMDVGVSLMGSQMPGSPGVISRPCCHPPVRCPLPACAVPPGRPPPGPRSAALSPTQAEPLTQQEDAEELPPRQPEGRRPRLHHVSPCHHELPGGRGWCRQGPTWGSPKSPAPAVPFSGSGFGVGPVRHPLTPRCPRSTSCLVGTWYRNVPRSRSIPGVGTGGRMTPLMFPFPPKSGFSLVMNHPACVNEITLSLNNKNAR